MAFCFNEIMFPKWNLNWPIWTQWQGIALNKIKLYRMGPWMTNYQGALPAAYVWLSFSLKLHFKNSCCLWNQFGGDSYIMVIIHTNHCFENALSFYNKQNQDIFILLLDSRLVVMLPYEWWFDMLLENTKYGTP